jgi:hypothetical protein
MIARAIRCAVAAASVAIGAGARAAIQPDPLDFTAPYVPPPVASGAVHPLTDVGLYDSLPGATRRVYLDFVGETNYDWNGASPGVTPAYDIDGDPTTFSDQELSNIHEIWQRVAEKYSIFNINVTTVDPIVYNHLETTKLVIGGDGTNGQSTYWAGGKYGGISYVGGFGNPTLPNIGYVFSGNLGNGNAKYVAEASAHEAGHTFGLVHQAVWSGTTKLFEYNPGTAAKAPIMGRSYDSVRGLWWRGTDDIWYNRIQADLDNILGEDNGGITFRDDDHGNDIAHATHVNSVGGVLSAAGIIETMPDKDYFSFDTTGGNASFEVDPFSPGGMLDASLWLYRDDGTLIASSVTTNLSESLTATLAAGTYDIVVGGAGNYGDLGQYTLMGDLNVVPEPASLLVLLSATPLLRIRRRSVRNRFSRL